MKEVQDRVVQFSNRYKLTNAETGEVLGTFDFDEVTGTVQQVGTEIDKELFDSISADITAEAQARAAADTTLQGNIDAEKAARETAVKAVNDKADAHIARVDNPHAVTKAQVGLGNVNNTSDANKPVSTAQAAAIADAKQAGTYAQQLANAHIARTDNPHSVTKAQVGLGNVDNTSDINKPVSTLQAKAIADAKQAGTDAQNTANTHIANKSNPHAVTKAQIGLENVDNTSDEDKPVSTAQAAAIKQEADAREAEDNNIKAELNNKYTKPSSGIPKTDLAESVQQSITKADTALQYIPIASHATLGGVKPVVKTSEMTQPVGINTSGELFTKPANIPDLPTPTTSDSNKFLTVSNGEYALAPVFSELANPNILINSNFKINQRGASSYDSDNYGYTVDRWSMEGGSSIWTSSSVTPVSNGLEIKSHFGGILTVDQPIEEGLIVSGETYTLSATVDGVQKNVSFAASSTTRLLSFAHATVTFSTDGRTGADYKVSINVVAGKTVTVNNVKLEKGAQATAYVTPEPTIERLRCYRYYQKFTGVQAFAGSISASANIGYFGFDLIVPMRDTPTVSYSSGNVRTLTGQKSLTGVAMQSGGVTRLTKMYLKLSFSTSGVTSLTPAFANVNDLAFDAEI